MGALRMAFTSIFRFKFGNLAVMSQLYTTLGAFDIQSYFSLQLFTPSSFKHNNSAVIEIVLAD